MTVLDQSPHELKGKKFTLADIDLPDGRFTVWEEPVQGGTYVIGGDCAKGMEKGDYDAAAVYIKPGERDKIGQKPRQVAELHGHWGERFDRLLYSAAMLYGGAFILLERQEGLSIMRRLWDEYGYTYIYYQRDPAQPNRKVRDALGHARVHDDFAMRNLMVAIRNKEIEPRSRDFIEQARKLEWFKPGEEPGISDRPTDASLKMRLPGGGSPDLCLAGGTMIETEAGPCPIESVHVGDLVWTRKGFRRVVWSAMTNADAAVYEVRMSNGAALVGTDNHPVFVRSRGFVPVSALVYGDTLEPCSIHAPSCSTESRSLAIPNLASGIFGATTRPTELTLAPVLSLCIERFGRPRTAPSLAGARFITSTRIPSITPWEISNYSRSKSTGDGTGRKCARRRGSEARIPSGLQVFGPTTPPTMAQSTMHASPNATPSICTESSTSTSASGAGESLRATERPLCVRAPEPAYPPCDGPADWTMRRGRAPTAPGHSSPTVSDRSSAARVRVESVTRLPGARAVYNLEVDGENEYFASGVLVHNCMAHVYANLALREVFTFDKPEDLFAKGSYGDEFGYGKVFAKDESGGMTTVFGDGTMRLGR